MDKLIKIKMEEFASALSALEKVVNNKEGIKIDKEIIRDSAIQRFEFTSEIAWKTLKIFLSTEKGVEVGYPKPAYREAQKIGIITPEETQLALEMVSDRNRIAHDYSEDFSDILFEKIQKKYSVLLRKIYEQLIR